MRRRLYGGGEEVDPPSDAENKEENALWRRGNRGQEDNKERELSNPSSPPPPTSPTRSPSEGRAQTPYTYLLEKVPSNWRDHEEKLLAERELHEGKGESEKKPISGEEDREEEALETTLENIMDQRGEGLRLGEGQHIETALSPKSPLTPKKKEPPLSSTILSVETPKKQEAPLSSTTLGFAAPKRQGRLYNFVGMKAPKDAAIRDAIDALAPGERPTKDMFAMWGREGVAKRREKYASLVGDQGQRARRTPGASVIEKRRFQPTRKERLHMCAIMARERQHYDIKSTKEENQYWRDMLAEFTKAKTVQKLKKIWKGRKAGW